jgi:general stress protein YciG
MPSKRGFANLSPEKHKEVSARGGMRKGPKGFANLSPERLKEISSKGSKERWRRVREKRNSELGRQDLAQ